MTEEKFTLLSDLGDWTEFDDTTMLERSREFYDMIRKRHTIRHFSGDPVAREIVETCIKAAGTAPSGANHQPWHFALVGDPAIKKQVREAAEEEERAFYAGKASDEWLEALEPIGTDENKPHLENAPWLICIFSQRRGGVEAGEDRKNYYIHESVGIATGFLITALHEAGLVTLTHTPNPMNFLTKILNRPATEKPYLILAVGKPSADATVPEHAMKKKALKDIMSVF